MRSVNFFVVVLFILVSVSCQEEEPLIEKETGLLCISLGLFIHVDEVDNLLKATQETGDFKVIIYHDDGTEALSYEKASEMPDVIELETGDYYVAAYSDNNLPAAFENPYYHGISEVFTVSANRQQSVLINCELANTKVGVIYSDQVKELFSEYTTTVSSALGSLVFTKEETRAGYFQPQPLDINVELVYIKPDESEGNKVLTGSIPAPLAKMYYEIHVDATINEGMAVMQIILEDTVAQVEIVEISDQTTNESGDIAYGDLLITEIMYNPAALSDTEGEWFEVYNHSADTIDLQNLMLGRDDSNWHAIAESVMISPGEYIVLARTEEATEEWDYIYGSDLSLTNSSGVLTVYNEGTETEPGAVIFSVDYFGADFPACTGASLSLNPDLLNVADAVDGTSWCAATSVYDTGDLGTPGAMNDSCIAQQQVDITM